MNFERDLQALITSADEVNRRESALIKEVLSLLGGWAAAKANNTEQLRQRIVRLGAALPQPVPAGQPQAPANGEWPAILRQQPGMN